MTEKKKQSSKMFDFLTCKRRKQYKVISETKENNKENRDDEEKKINVSDSE